MNKLLFVLLFFLHANGLRSQSFALQEVKGLPTQEIFNLHVDKKGFLWIAHNLGLSRYDGSHFTHFSSPRENSLSMFELTEDSSGTIWCHDLSGQIFYVKDEKMHYLAEYEHSSELIFPKMVIVNNLLLVTSLKGLFICDTRTLKSHYVYLPGRRISQVTSLCVINDKVLLSEGGQFYLHDLNTPSQFLTPVALGNYNYNGEIAWLHREVVNDTALLVDQTKKCLYKVVVENNNPRVVDTVPVGAFINTISVFGNKIYCNTKHTTQEIHSGESITGYNISDIKIDHEGNTWVSSLEKGLLVHYRQQWQNVELPALNGAHINRIAKSNRYQVYGDREGQLLVKDLRKDQASIFSIALDAGPVEYLKFVDDHQIFAGCSFGLLYVDLVTRTWQKFSSPTSVKDISNAGNGYYGAASMGLLWFPKENGALNLPKAKVMYVKRMRAVLCDTAQGQVFAAFNHGLYVSKGGRWRSLRYKGQNLFGSSLHSYGDKIYITTFNVGLIVCDKKDTLLLNRESGLLSNIILGCRQFDDHLWLIFPNGLQVIDLPSAKLCRHFNVPPLPPIPVNDIYQSDSTVIVASGDGLFSIPLQAIKETPPPSLIMHVQVNGKDTIAVNPALKHNSSIRFAFSIPIFEGADQIVYKYRLAGGGNESWSYLRNGDNDIDFPTIAPGEYLLEVYAWHPRFSGKGIKMVYPFSVTPAWYNTWWFRIMMVLAIIAVFFGLYRYRLYQIAKVDALRRKVSSNLHDDIGSTLSSINIYSQLAKTEEDNREYLEAIQSHTQTVISNLDDLVWVINPKTDSVETLIERMKDFSLPLLAAKKIQAGIAVENDQSVANISADQRTNLYLSFKEMVNNVAKHSEADTCHLAFRIVGRRIMLSVTDNGKGFDIRNINAKRNGLRNLESRARENNGEFTIISTPGEGTHVTFSIKV